MTLRNLNYLKATLAVSFSLLCLSAFAEENILSYVEDKDDLFTEEFKLGYSQYKGIAEFTGTIPGNLDPTRPTTDGFGSSVKLNGDWAFVSAPIARANGLIVSGAVYVFKKHNGNYSTTPKQIIDIPEISLHLGLLKIESQDDWLFISGLGDNDFRGSLQIFKLNHNTDQWDLFQTLSSTTVPQLANLAPIAPPALTNPTLTYTVEQGASFGVSFGVDVKEKLLVVGAQYQTTDPSIINAGRAYAFKLENGSWVYKQTLSNPDGIAINDTFGAQVALRGKLALVSNGSVFQGPRQDKASVYVYTYKNGQWNFVQKVQGTQTNQTPVLFATFGLPPPSINIADTFGSALALSKDWAVIGAAFENLGSTIVHGAVYFYKVNTSSNNPLSFRQKIYSTDINPIAQNFSLTGAAVDGDTAVISNVSQTGPTAIPFQGAANVYLYKDGKWKLDGVLSDPQGQNTRLFGSGVDVQGKNIIVGAGFNGLNLLVVGTPPLSFLPPPNNLPPFPSFRNAVIYKRN